MLQSKVLVLLSLKGLYKLTCGGYCLMKYNPGNTETLKKKKQKFEMSSGCATNFSCFRVQFMKMR